DLRWKLRLLNLKQWQAPRPVPKQKPFSPSSRFLNLTRNCRFCLSTKLLGQQPVNYKLCLRSNEDLPVCYKRNTELGRHSQCVSGAALSRVIELVGEITSVIGVENPILRVIVLHGPDDAVSVAVA